MTEAFLMGFISGVLALLVVLLIAKLYRGE